jgi:hypothetical protein
LKRLDGLPIVDERMHGEVRQWLSAQVRQSSQCN